MASATKSTFTMSILSVGRNGSTGRPARNTNALTMSNCVVSACRLSPSAMLGDHFVSALARHGDRADFAEASQAVIVLGVPRQRQHLERAPEIHVQATLLRLAIQRCRAMDYGVCSVYQPVVFIA